MRLRSIPILGLGSLATFLLSLVAGLPQQAAPSHRPPPSQAANGPEGAIPMPADRAEDSYAIYSMLMPGQVFLSMPPEQNTQWAIAAITINEQDRNPAIPPQGQLKPPPDHPRRFNEAVGDYQANRFIRVQLTQPQFRIGHPFSLLAPDQVSELRAAKASSTAASEVRSRWAGYPGITFFSEVYFDTHHTAALVYMNDWCSHLCAAGSWVYLEKQGSRWQQRSGIVVPGA